MNIRHTFIASVLPFVSLAALAADPVDAGAPSRASANASVIAARAAHQLRPAGEAAEYDPPTTASMASAVARADVNEQVRVARAKGELRPAGEADSYSFAPDPLTWERSRAEVKAEFLAARANGELIPAGGGTPVSFEATSASRQSAQRFAKAHKQRTAQ